MEFLMQNVDNLNWWAIVVASLVVFPVGFIWYSLRVGFGKRWMDIIGLDVNDLSESNGMAKTFTMLTILSVLTSIVTACLLKATGTVGFWDSVIFGLIIGCVIRGGAHVIHNGFAKRSDQLTLIDAAHDTVAFALVCGVLGLWA
jgi:hypothetical protein